MKGTIYYTRDFAGLKTGQVNLFDIGGNSRSERGQMLDQIAEWNVDSNLNNVGVHSHCNDTVCTMTESIVVSNGSLFGYGMCPGDMLWSYIHVHGGTLGGNVDVNGIRQCDILPKIGTDPNNAIGNEQGFLVGMGMCVDYRATGKKLRLNLGDVVTATAYYDVNPRSTKYLPLPGGKHGGIMALFFSVIECDAGTWNEVYVRRNNTCVGTPRSKSSRVGTFYQDKASCETQANPQESSTLEIAPPTSEEQTSLEEVEQSGKVDLVWRDCGKSSKWANISSLTPESMTIGGYTNLKAFGNLSRDVEEGNFTIKMSSGGFGLTLLDFSGDVCNDEIGKWTLEDQIHLTWFPFKCPVQAADGFAAHLRLFVDPLVPRSIAHTTTTVMIHSREGEEIGCVEVVTASPKTSELLV